MTKQDGLKAIPYFCASALLILGIILCCISEVTQVYITVILGGTLICCGSLRLLYGLVANKEQADARFNLLFCIPDLVLGILLLIFMSNYFMFMIMFAFWIIISGVLEVGVGVSNTFDKLTWLIIIATAVCKIVFGIVMLCVNFGSFSHWVIYVGIFLILHALSIGFASMKFKKINIKKKNNDQDVGIKEENSEEEIVQK